MINTKINFVLCLTAAGYPVPGPLGGPSPSESPGNSSLFLNFLFVFLCVTGKISVYLLKG